MRLWLTLLLAFLVASASAYAPNPKFSGTNSVAVGYDPIGQLTSWNGKEASGLPRLNEQLALAYDAAHNLISRTNGLLSQGFVVDAANELTNITRNSGFTLTEALPAPATNVALNGINAQVYSDFTFAATNRTLEDPWTTFAITATNVHGASASDYVAYYLPASVNFQYDANGNLTNDGTRSFAYDWENQVTNVQAGGWRTDFVYDGLGRRRIERDFAWQSGAWSKTNELHFIYDGSLLVQMRDANNNVLVTYTRGLDLSGTLGGAGGIGGVLARTDANGSTFYHADGEGNVTALIDGQEDIVARYLYNPFGKLLGQWGSLASVSTMQFSSMPFHANSGLSLYPSRAYDPTLQRWLNEDPIGELGGMNLFGFVGNNPAAFADPHGLSLFNYLYQAGQGLYDMMMGDQSGSYNQNTLGALEANELGGIDPNNNVLRDSMGQGLAEAGEFAKEAALTYLGGKAGDVLGEMGGRALCKIKPLLKALGEGGGEEGAAAQAAGDASPAGTAAPEAASTGTAGASAAEGEVGAGQTLYRGVWDDHPAFQDALEGSANPRGGSATPLEHNLGDTRSIHTAWTTDPALAAERAGPGGVVLQQTFPASRLVRSPDLFGEGEVLVTGPVRGAFVTPIPKP